MPIFDNEPGFKNVSRDYPTLPSFDSPRDANFENLPELPISSFPHASGIIPNLAPQNNLGASVEDISNLAKLGPSPLSPNSAFESVSKSELAANNRYKMFQRGVDLENIHALTQPWYHQVGNGLAKMGIFAAGTFAQSFYTIPDTIEAARNGDVSKLLGLGGDEDAIDNWRNNFENVFPNYYSRYEQEHPFKAMIPFNTGFANFAGDKVLKNLGFTAGAIGGAVVQDAAIDAAAAYVTGGVADLGLIPVQLTQLVGKLALGLNKIFSGTNKLEEVLNLARATEKTGKQALNLKRLVELTEGNKALVNIGSKLRYGTALYGSARTESAVEGRDGYYQIKNALIKEYQDNNYGQIPTGEALAKIEKFSLDGANARFGVNMALLTVSDAIQFDGILKSFNVASRSAKNIESALGKLTVKEGSVDELERYAAKTFSEKVWDKVKIPARNMFTEGVYEEGGQYAAERGTLDYYTNRYKKNKKETDPWLSDAIDSTIKGLKDQFGTDAGIENMVLGAFTAALSGVGEKAITKAVNKIKGFNEKEYLTTTLNNLNESRISGALINKYQDTTNSIEIAKQMKDAAASGNIFKYKNLKADLFFTKVMQRIKMGMHDVTIDQLKMMKDLPEDQFKEMFGVDFDSSNKKTVSDYVDKLIDTANSIKQTSDVVDASFANPFEYIKNAKEDSELANNRNYTNFELWKINLKNFAFNRQNKEDRIKDISENINKINPYLNNALVSSLLDKNGLAELADSYSQDASLKEQSLETIPSNERAQVRADIKKLRTISEKISMAISKKEVDPKLFEEVLNLELNNRDFTKSPQITFDKINELMSYGEDINKLNNQQKIIAEQMDMLSTKEGIEKFFASQEQPSEESIDESKEPVEYPFKNHEGKTESAEVGREYENSKLKLVKPIKEGNKYKIIKPNGETIYKDTKEEALDAAKEINADISDLAKIKILAFNEDGTVKVEDINGNIQNLNLSELSGYKSLATKQETLAKNADQIAAEQNKFEKESASVPTQSSEPIAFESKKKDVSILFKSTTTSTETLDNSDQASPHIRRSRIFLNNVFKFKNRRNYKLVLITAANAKAAGLDGIIQLSYGYNPNEVSLEKLIEKLPAKSNPVSGEKAFLAQVYVYKEGKDLYFVNENGEKISKVGEENPKILEQVTFQTMPGESLYWSGEDKSAMFRQDQEAEAEQELLNYKAFRKRKLKQKVVGPSYGFGVSRGIQIEDEVTQDNPVSVLLGDELADKLISGFSGLIEVVTTGKIQHNNELLSFPNGAVVLKYQDFLGYINNKKLTEEQAVNIATVLEAIGNEMTNMALQNKPVKIPAKYRSFIQNVLYWKSSGELESENQVSIDKDAKTLRIGSKRFDLTDISANKKEVVDALQNVFFNVNDRTLKKGVATPFTEYGVTASGELTSIEWKNYQQYLLSDKYPDGTPRPTSEIPLITHAVKPTTAVPYSFLQKYSFITDDTFEFPIVQVTKTEVKEEQPVAEQSKDEYINDGKHINSFKKISKGKEIKFTSKYEGDKLSIDIIEDDTFNDIVKTSAEPVRVAIADQIAKGEIEDISNEGVIKYFLADQIRKDIEAQKQAPITTVETITEEAPKVTKKENKKPAEITLTKTQDDFYNVKVQPSAGSNFEAIYVPRALYELAYANDTANQERSGDAQTLDTIIKRGGYTVEEFDKLLPNWREELAKLSTERQNKKPAEVKTRKNVKPISRNNNFRRVGVNDIEKMTDQEFEQFKKWHSKNVPNIPFEVLEQMIKINDNEYAWGVFENGVAKFVKGGLKGTEYHEIFEGIWANLLTETEKNNILNEFRSQKGEFIDRETGKEYSYSDPMITNQMIKERIADDFSDYRLGKTKATSLKEKIRNFFKRIMDFFKTFIGTKAKNEKSLKEQLFEQIEKGKFKERPIIGSEKLAPQYRKIEGLGEAEVNAYVNDIIANIASIVYGDENYKKELLFNPDSIDRTDIIGEVRDIYIENGQYNFLGEQRFNDIITRAKEKLRTVGVSFNELDESEDSDEKNHKDYIPETFSTDWKGSSTKAIRFSIATMLEREPLNQKGATTLEFTEPVRSKEIMSEDEELSSEDRYLTGGLVLVNYNKVFATLLNKLANTTSIADFSRKLVELAETDSNYVAVLKRLGADLTVRDEDTGEIKQNIFNFDSFTTDEDWEYFAQFYLTFTRNKPETLIQYIKDGEVYTNNANIYSDIKDTVDSWIYNMKSMSSDAYGWISYNKAQKIYKINTDEVKNFIVRQPEDMVAFLAKIGIDFPLDIYNKLSSKEVIVGNKTTTEKTEFGDAIKSIRAYLGKNNNLINVRENTLNISKPLRTLAKLYNSVTNPNQDPTFFGVEGKRRGTYTENNAPSLFEDDFNESNTLTELLEKRPELKGYFSENSQVLKKGGLFFNEDGDRVAEIKLLSIDGTQNQDTNKNKKTTSLSLGERFVQEINQNIYGNYYVLVPGDGSTEWMMNLGNSVSLEEIQNDSYKKKVNKIFKGYLMDEVKLALYGDSKTLNVKNKSKQLRFMRDILDSTDVQEIEKRISDKNATLEKVEEYINKNIESINSAVEKFVSEVNDELLDTLLAYGQVEMLDENKYNIKAFDTEFLQKNDLDKLVSKEELDALLKFLNFNYIINNIEYHKFIFGDPYQFKIKEDGNLDETKRIKSFLSPRRRLFDHEKYNNFLRQKYNTVDGILLDSSDDKYTYHQFDSKTNTVTLSDIEIRGSISMMKDLDKVIKDAYNKVTEADAMSLIQDNTYREVKIKAQQWSKQAEKFHQWQMAYTRLALSEKKLEGSDKYVYEYKNNKLKQHDIELTNKKQPKFLLDVMKPTVSGNKANKTDIDLVLDKMSQMPLYYSMVEGTNLEKLYLKMKDQNVGYVVYQTGRKVGSEGNNNIYNQGGSFNDVAFTNIVEVPWSSYGILVDTASQKEKQQPRGSQLTKIASIDLFDNGEATDEVRKIYDDYKESLDNLNDFYYNEILNKLGVVDLGDGFAKESGEAISAALVREMLRQNVSENLKDTIKIDEETKEFLIPFEASPSYTQIRNIIYSIVNNNLISPKMTGAPHVQVPVTMFETGNRKIAIKKGDNWETITNEEYEKLPDEEKNKTVLTDDTLKFYTREEPWCEIMLPAWFKNQLTKGKLKDYTDEQLIKYLDTEEGAEILSGIGFRIPTQALSSVERFRVKGFLPEYMGYTVVVPSEITTKAGSDFDIDKLNIYLKSIYIDENGDIRLIKLKGSEEQTKEFYANVYDKTIKAKIEKIENKDEFRGNLFDILKIVEQVVSEGETNLLDRLTSSQEDFYNKYQDILQAVIDQAFEEGVNPTDYISAQQKKLNDVKDSLTLQLLDGKLKESFVTSTYKKALENEYYAKLDDLLGIQDFERIISPVTDAGLKDDAKRLDDLRGYDESTIPGRLVNRVYMTANRHAYVIGKRWVGIVAVNITGHSNRQKGKVYLDFSNTENLTYSEQQYFKNFDIAVPHNTVKVNDEELVSLSGIMTADGTQHISDRLSGYATSVVDIANDPFIVKIIQSENIISTFMFLESIGAGKAGVMFLNQPIIDEYLKILDKKNSKSLLTIQNVEEVKMMFPTTGAALIDAKIDASINSLEKNIENYYKNEKKLGDAKNAEQQLILDEFIKYSILAGQLFEYNQAMNYDTTRFTSGDFLYKKQLLTEKVQNNSIIKNSEEILDNTHIGKLKSLLVKSNNAIGQILKLEDPKIKAYSEPTLRRYAEKKYMSSADYDKIANLIRNSFLDYIIETTSSINSEIGPLLINKETNVATKLSALKNKYPDIQILKDLEVVPEYREGGAVSVRLKANVKGDIYSENLYVGMMRELRDSNEELNSFYNDLVNVSILQGSSQSAISIRNIIPVEDYSAKISPIIDQLHASTALEEFNNNMFERNNFLNNLIFDKYELTSFELTDVSLIDGIQRNVYAIPAFIDDGTGIINRAERKLMAINRSKNFIASQSDFLKVPRVAYNEEDGMYVDVTNGKQITGEDFKKMKAAGNNELYENYYYRRVYTKDEDGNRIPLRNGNVFYFALMNVYGDGNRAVENPTTLTPSVIENGSIKVNTELRDQDIINYVETKKLQFGKPVAVNKVTTPTVDLSKGKTITYTPIGKSEQTYTVIGKDIYNKKGQRVFGTAGKDRNRIFANLAVKEGRAVVVIWKDRKYVVNDKDQIISSTGDLMKWDDNNGDRKGILQEAINKRASKTSNVSQNKEIVKNVEESPSENNKNLVSLPTDKEIMDSVDFKRFAITELEKDPSLSIEQILEYFKTCGNG